MASRIRVTTQELRKQAGELENLNAAFCREVGNLGDDETLLGQSYRGDAQVQFHNQFVNDAEKFNQFAQVIAQFIQQLREDADAYDKVEAENASIAMTRK